MIKMKLAKALRPGDNISETGIVKTAIGGTVVLTNGETIGFNPNDQVSVLVPEAESYIQQSICVWYNNNFCLAHYNPRFLIMSIPNGGERSFISANLSKATGEYIGASDLIVIHLGQVLFIETKIPTGLQSKSQIAFQQHVEQTGHEYFIIRSLSEFKSIIEQKTRQALSDIGDALELQGKKAELQICLTKILK